MSRGSAYRPRAVRHVSAEHTAKLRKLVVTRGSVRGMAEQLHLAEMTVLGVMSGATFLEATAKRIEEIVDKATEEAAKQGKAA